ncbi:MAG TPA: zf-HC2 domain-containing protein [Thermoanaerobaculia bacterium]|nr:zf-HC2 domain-containing protein [Thermoanaerobaculia bacterium]
MDCVKVKEVVFLLVDNEADENLLNLLQQHLDRCPGCAREVAYARLLVTVVRQRCRRAVAPDRLRRRILTCLPHRTPPSELEDPH